MKRPVATAQLGISLFPFLAVLLCTMGALIVLLVVINRNSRNLGIAERRQQATSPSAPRAAVVDQANASAQAAETANNAKVEAARLAKLNKTLSAARDTQETLEWRLTHLRESRDKTAEDLRQERLRLSGAEAQVRRLEDQVRNLAAALGELNGNSQTKGLTLAQMTEQLRQAQASLSAAKDRLREKQTQAVNQKPVYSVVPYDGPNRTSRRPIYIECTRNRVILQPEGIELVPGDFVGPLGPGNPLAAAVRAARDHLVEQNPQAVGPDAEPYPLFLVRPDGIEAYYKAREAMLSYAHDIGYQAVDQDWDLAYPAADPQLAQREARALDLARKTYVEYVRRNPQLAQQDKPRAGYRVSPITGGLVRESGPDQTDNEPRSAWSSPGNSGLPASNGIPGATAAQLAANDQTRLATSSGTGTSVSGKFGTGNRNGLGNGNGLGSGSALANGNRSGGTEEEPWRLTGGGSESGGGNGISNGAGSNGGIANSNGNGVGSGKFAGSPYVGLDPQLGNGGAANGNAKGNADASQFGAVQDKVAGQVSPTGDLAANQSGKPSGASASGTATSGSVGKNSNQSSSGSASPNANATGGTASSTGAVATNGTSTGGGAGGTANSPSGSSGDPSVGGGSLDGVGGSPNIGAGNSQFYPKEEPFSRTSAPLPNRTRRKDSELQSIAKTRGKDWGLAHAKRDTNPVIRPIKLLVNADQVTLPADPTADDPTRVIALGAATADSMNEFIATVERRIKKWGIAGNKLYWSPELIFDVSSDGEDRYADLAALLDQSGWTVKRRNPPQTKIFPPPPLPQATPTIDPALNAAPPATVPVSAPTVIPAIPASQASGPILRRAALPPPAGSTPAVTAVAPANPPQVKHMIEGTGGSGKFWAEPPRPAATIKR